jgi:multiple sugar transport system permease protein
MDEMSIQPRSSRAPCCCASPAPEGDVSGPALRLAQDRQGPDLQRSPRSFSFSFGRLLARLVLIGAGISALLPVLWTLLNSFKNRVDIVSVVPKFIFTPTLENYAYVLGRASVANGLVNSAIVVGSAVAIGAALGLPAAYALARYPLRWADDIQFFVLSMRFLPPVAVAIPLMVIWLQLGLYDTRVALIVTYTLLTLSSVIWLAIPAFKAVPKEVEEAGRVDGYGPYAIFFRVALPIAGRSLTGAIAFGFVLVWNEFLIALMLTTSDAKTLPIVASELSQLGRDVPWGILNASVILLSLPPLLMVGVLSGFLNAAFQRRRTAR